MSAAKIATPAPIQTAGDMPPSPASSAGADSVGEGAVPVGATAAGELAAGELADADASGDAPDPPATVKVNWSETVNLALGVTTRHDPSSRSALVFPALEMVRAGKIIGPRSFSTGEIVYGAKNPHVYAQIDSKADALAHIRRLKAQGAHSIKNYNQPRRNQRRAGALGAVRFLPRRLDRSIRPSY